MYIGESFRADWSAGRATIRTLKGGKFLPIFLAALLIVFPPFVLRTCQLRLAPYGSLG
jgi:hypothetical protein